MKQVSMRSSRRKLVAGIVLSSVVFLAVGGAYAVHQALDRPGEGALRYAPADSLIAVSFDLVPSPAQAIAFKHIDDSLGRNDMAKFLEHSVLDIVEHGPMADALHPLIKRSGAFCLESLDGPGQGSSVGTSPIIFIALTDSKQAATILSTQGHKGFYKGFTYYKSGDQGLCMAVLDDLLVLTDKPAAFLKVKDIADGSAKPITSLPEFAAARQSISSDANVVAYFSPKLGTSFLPASQKDAPMPDWLMVGLAVRDGGIGLSCASRMDPVKSPSVASLGSMAPIRSDLFDVLPAGAYGMTVVSQPAKYYDVAKTTYGNTKDFAKGMADAEQSIQKSIGLSVKMDIIPALEGDAIIAAYSRLDGTGGGADLLVVVDDQNGADPGQAVDRFRDFVEQQMAKEGNSPKFFNEKDINGGREYRLNDKQETDMRKSLGYGQNNADFDTNAFAGNKTVVYAVVGKVVLASTSQDLLDKAIATYASKTNGLTGDPKFSSIKQTVMDGSQSIAVFSLSRIAEGVRHTVHSPKDNPDAAKLIDSILSAFSTVDEPLYLKGKMSTDGVSTGGVFIPLDYDKVIDIIGGEMNKHKGAARP